MFDAKFLLDSLVQGVSEIGDQLKNIQPDDVIGNVTKVAGDAFDQATAGVKDIAGKAMDTTGVDEKLDAVVSKVSGGQSASELIDKAKDVIGDNKVEASILLGGLSALLLGSKRGRKVTKKAAAVGGAALIGGLAYQAFQNFRDGKPLLGGDDEEVIEAAPTDSGFGSKALSNEQAVLLVRAMVAAAASDQKIDETERMRIALGLRDVGLESGAADFLEAEFKSPVSVDQLAASVDSPELASQVYTAARLTIEPDTEAEQAFLARLAEALALEADLVDHLNATAGSVKAAA